MRSTIIGFGLLILCLLILFRIGEVNFERGNIKLEVIVAIAAFFFFLAGLYFNYKTQKNQEASAAKAQTNHASTTDINHEQIKKAGLTQREHDVLVKLCDGLSNQEIASALYLSESTVKTHVSNILFKLDAKRRTEAIRIAKDKKIVA
jgi:DNA-binding NarL/FixJ family response regulator